MNWAEIEKHCGKRPNGTVMESAWWASRVENYLRMKRMEREMNQLVILDRSNEIIISGENCRLEILSLLTDAHGRRHVLLKSHALEKGAEAGAQENKRS